MGPSYNNFFETSQPSISPSPASYDPLLTSPSFLPPQKSKKKLLIILACLVVLIVAVLIVFFIDMNNKNTKRTTMRSFAAFLQAKDKNLEGEDYVTAIAIYNDSVTAIENYYVDLHNRYNEFKDVTRGVFDDTTMKKHTDIMKALENTINHRKVLRDAVGVFEDDGEAKAIQYINDLMNYDEDDNTLSTISFSQGIFYETALDNHKLYHNSGCYEDGTYDSECFLKLPNSKLKLEALQEETRYLKRMVGGSIKKMLNQLTLDFVKSIETRANEI